jgi:hypothetical protein
VRESNVIPITITPVVSNYAFNNNTNVVTLTGDLFQNPLIIMTTDNQDVQVLVDMARVDWADGNPITANTFLIISATQIDLQLPANIVAGQLVSFRVIVKGVESPPYYVNV